MTGENGSVERKENRSYSVTLAFSITSNKSFANITHFLLPKIIKKTSSKKKKK